MNVFNRIVIALLDLFLIASAVVVLLLTFGVLTSQQVVPPWASETALGQWITSFARMSPAATLLVTLVAVVVIVLGLALAVLELRPTPQERTIAIRADGIGRVTVRLESVRDLIVYTASHLPDILQVQPTLAQTPQGLTIHCRTSLTPNARIPQVTAELQTQVKQAVEQHLGMKVAAVTVEAQLEPLAGAASQQRPRSVARVLR